MPRSRRKQRQRKDEGTQTITLTAGRLAIGLVAMAVLAGVGLTGWYFAQRSTQTTTAAATTPQGQFTQLPNASSQTASGQQNSGQQRAAVAQEPAGAQFLGPETDAEGLAQAEAGQLGQPALVWFHADWCTICQAIKPTVAQVEKKWDGRVDLIRLNVDNPAARDAVRGYQVRGTPTFVFISKSGKVVDSMVGWPGQGRVEQSLTELLAVN